MTDVIYVMLLIMAMSLTEVSIAWVMRYRYKMLFIAIIALNVITVGTFEIIFTLQGGSVLVWQVALSLFLMIGVESIALRRLFPSRYTSREIVLLVAWMNVISMVLRLLLFSQIL